MRALLTFLGLSLSVAGCAPAAPMIASASPAPATATLPSASSPAGDARRVRSRTLDFPVELRLPGKDSWQIDERAWLVAKQASTHSELALRTWRAERLVRRADCLAQ